MSQHYQIQCYSHKFPLIRFITGTDRVPIKNTAFFNGLFQVDRNKILFFQQPNLYIFFTISLSTNQLQASLVAGNINNLPLSKENNMAEADELMIRLTRLEAENSYLKSLLEQAGIELPVRSTAHG